MTSLRSLIHPRLVDLIGTGAEPPPPTLLSIMTPQVIGAIDRIPE